MMTEVWLVDREFDSKGLVRLTYATTDGTRVHTKEIAEQRLFTGNGITAARDVGDEALGDTEPENVERFATEALRMAEKHDPDETI